MFRNYKNIPTNKRRKAVKTLVSMLYLYEPPWFRRKLIEKTPSYEEDMDGQGFKSYIEALQLYKYVIDEDLELATRCRLAQIIFNTPEFHGLYDDYLSNFLADSCFSEEKEQTEDDVKKQEPQEENSKENKQ